MTLCPARSEAIHWPRNRIVNNAWARSPSNTHQSSLVMKTSVRYAPIACDISTSKGDLHGFGNALFATNEPPHAKEVSHADPQPIPEAIVRRTVPARPVQHLDIADFESFATDQRWQKAMNPV